MGFETIMKWFGYADTQQKPSLEAPVHPPLEFNIKPITTRAHQAANRFNVEKLKELSSSECKALDHQHNTPLMVAINSRWIAGQQAQVNLLNQEIMAKASTIALLSNKGAAWDVQNKLHHSPLCLLLQSISHYTQLQADLAPLLCVLENLLKHRKLSIAPNMISLAAQLHLTEVLSLILEHTTGIELLGSEQQRLPFEHILLLRDAKLTSLSIPHLSKSSICIKANLSAERCAYMALEHIVVPELKWKVLRILLEKGLDVNLRFIFAKELPYHEGFEIYPTQENYHLSLHPGDTMLHYFVRQGHREIVQDLLKNFHANPNIPNDWYELPLRITQDPSIRALLEQADARPQILAQTPEENYLIETYSDETTYPKPEPTSRALTARNG